MNTTHATERSAAALLAALLLLVPHGAAAQTQGDADRAASLHRRGAEGARKGDKKEALKDLGEALNLRLKLFGFETNAQGRAEEEPTREQSEGRRLRYAAAARALAETAEQYAALEPPDAGVWRTYLETLRLLASFAEDKRFQTEPFRLGRFYKKAVIISKPEPGFTERAREAGTSGVVRVRALLGADGRVGEVAVIKSLPDGLTEKAVAAARRIQFQPATLEGRPVPQLVVLEYNFSVYIRRP